MLFVKSIYTSLDRSRMHDDRSDTRLYMKEFGFFFIVSQLQYPRSSPITHCANDRSFSKSKKNIVSSFSLSKIERGRERGRKNINNLFSYFFCSTIYSFDTLRVYRSKPENGCSIDWITIFFYSFFFFWPLEEPGLSNGYYTLKYNVMAYSVCGHLWNWLYMYTFFSI